MATEVTDRPYLEPVAFAITNPPERRLVVPEVDHAQYQKEHERERDGDKKGRS
jgi:hypothetical protein